MRHGFDDHEPRSNYCNSPGQITKTPKRIQTDKLIKRNAVDARKIRAAKERSRPAFLDADIDRAAQETRYVLDMAEIQWQFWAHWESQTSRRVSHKPLWASPKGNIGK